MKSLILFLGLIISFNSYSKPHKDCNKLLKDQLNKNNIEHIYLYDRVTGRQKDSLGMLSSVIEGVSIVFDSQNKPCKKYELNKWWGDNMSSVIKDVPKGYSESLSKKESEEILKKLFSKIKEVSK